MATIRAAIRSPELLRYAHVVSAPRTELRGEHADAGSVADFINRVENVDDVEKQIAERIDLLAELKKKLAADAK